MIFGLEFPPISHVVEWPTLFGDGPFAVNKVIILMWVSAAIAFTVMYLGGRKGARCSGSAALLSWNCWWCWASS